MKRVIAMCMGLLIVLLTAGASPAGLNDGLVAYYPFNGNANDESGNGNNGTVNGAMLVNDRLGNANSAYSFDGVDDYIDCGNNTILDITDSITVSAWIKHDTGEPGSWEDILMKGNATYGFQFYSSEGYFTFHLTSDGWRNLSSNIKPAPGVWYHIVGTYNGSEQKVYINGELKNSALWTGQIESHLDMPLTIGYKVASDNSFFKGTIDEVSIYNRDLSECEIQTLYSNPCFKWDINGNNKFDLNDIIYGLQVLSGVREQDGFAITQADYPTDITCNGDKGDLTVSWQGNPKFPVTMIYRPRSCPQGGCSTVQLTFEQETNPLVGKEFLHCSGYTETSFFDYEVILNDADNNETPAKPAGFNCVVTEQQTEIILNSDPADELLFRVMGADGQNTYYHGSESDGTMRLTHIITEDTQGNKSVVILNDGLFPIQWITDEITAAVSTQNTHIMDPQSAFHVAVYGDTNELITLTADIYPNSLLTVVSEIETQTGQKFDNAREFLTKFNISDFNAMATLAGQKGTEQSRYLAAATAFTCGASALSLFKQSPSRNLRFITKPLEALVKIGAGLIGQIIAQELNYGLDNTGVPTVDVLLCRGAANYQQCHYLFFFKSELQRCITLCQTSMGCFTDICMPMQITSEMALNLEHDF